MPTYDYWPRFLREYHRLTPQQRTAFLVSVKKLVHDLTVNDIRAGLRVEPVIGHPDVYEMTWADDGRATFTFGKPVRPGHAHIIWRRIGTHDIFDEP
ncbi:MAG: hypothetical protein ACRDJE_12895 [Dehalococcoidia bacterium]